MPDRPLRPPVLPPKIARMSGTNRIRKNDVIASDQLPSRRPGMPVRMPTTSATAPAATSCSRISVCPACDISPAV
ncbi:hypothetical protein Br6_05252 [Rhodococcus sp. Br-6]|nr:hypothetical protein Br6_05252 [Rhodococcus sp. Br-6]